MCSGVAEFGAQVHESLEANHLAVFGYHDFFGGLPLASSVDVVKTTQRAKTPDELAGLRDFLQFEGLSFAFPVFVDVTVFRAGINGTLGFALGVRRGQRNQGIGFLESEERNKDCNEDPQ